jgi:hypothetical protein
MNDGKNGILMIANQVSKKTCVTSVSVSNWKYSNLFHAQSSFSFPVFENGVYTKLEVWKLYGINIFLSLSFYYFSLILYAVHK